MNPIQQLRALEQRVSQLEATVNATPPVPDVHKAVDIQKNWSYPRRVLAPAGKLLVRAFKELTNELIFPDLKTLIDKARSYENGDIVPTTVRSWTVHALIAEDHGMQVMWCNKRPPLESQDTSRDPRTVGRRNSPKLNGVDLTN